MQGSRKQYLVQGRNHKRKLGCMSFPVVVGNFLRGLFNCFLKPQMIPSN